MKLSYQWLQELLSKKIDVDQVASKLTSAGLEIDAITPVAAEFTHVVVAEIIEVQSHPDAERLKVCVVDVGEKQPITIVTNVASVAPGQKVPAALVGAVLPDGLKIEKTKLRGVPSFGMFCGIETLGLGEPTPGLLELPADAPVGQDLRRYLQLDDVSLDIALTPNRGDCLSAQGIARELAVVTDAKFKPIKIKKITEKSKEKLSVRVGVRQACPRYLGRLIKDINAEAVTPQWLAERLRRCGLRSIHPVVDVLNYVMLELGQPMHAFDADTLQGGIEVRLAKRDESIELLDGQTVKMAADTVVIADQKHAVAMAGIMGGKATAVSATTKNIFLESVFFAPDAMMGRARQYGLHTDSSHRFERGVDPELAGPALERATELLLSIVGGTPAVVVDHTDKTHLPKKSAITLRLARVSEMLGCEIPAAKISNIFSKLEMKVQKGSKTWKVTPPSYRFDINIEIDLIEEIARVYGYDQIPSHIPATASNIQPLQHKYRWADLLRALDYHEAMTYSFTKPELLRLLTPAQHPVVLANPISPELSAMRTTLWAGLLQAAQYNVNRQQLRVRLFETGLRFESSKKTVEQIPTLAGLVLGAAAPEQWGQPARTVDFYDLKADVEAVLALSKHDYTFVAAEHPALHPGQSAKIISNKETIGWIGALHPELQQQLDLPATYLFELNLNSLNAELHKICYQALSKFPAIRRDIAILTASAVSLDAICNTIRDAAGNLLNKLVIFDIYNGQGIPSGQKSVALGLVWQAADRTLSDEEINSLMSNVLSELKEKHKALLRE